MSQSEQNTRSSRPVVFAMANEQCVWARAGVIKPMACVNAFDCLGCAVDKRIIDAQAKRQRDNARNPAPRLSLLAGGRKCRHTLTGRLANKMCSRDYDCLRCPYDQMMSDSDDLYPYSRPAVDNVSGFNMGRDHYYHFGHTWARVEYGGRVRVGLDDFALRLLGPADQIKLPRLGEKVEQSRPRTEIERDGHQARAMSPVDGVVVAVNHKVAAQADTANREPYGEGWLMVVQPSGLRKNLKNLLFGPESQAWMDDEVGRLSALVAEETGHQLAATGGEAVGDIYGAAPQLGWDRLVTTFLG